MDHLSIMITVEVFKGANVNNIDDFNNLLLLTEMIKQVFILLY